MANSDNVLGETLSWLMKRAKLKNADVARVTDVDDTTVSKWRSGVNRPDDSKLGAIVGLLRARGVETSVAELRYGPTTGQEAAVAVREGSRTRPFFYGWSEVEFASTTATQRARHWLEGFLLELAEKGADQEFIESSRRLLLNPANYEYGFGAPPGSRDAMNDEQKLGHMQALAVGVREALKYRLKQLQQQRGKR